jgi:hypothetical protein
VGTGTGIESSLIQLLGEIRGADDQQTGAGAREGPLRRAFSAALGCQICREDVASPRTIDLSRLRLRPHWNQAKFVEPRCPTSGSVFPPPLVPVQDNE